MDRNSTFYKFGYFWVTLAFFLFSLVGHWLFSWYAYLNEQKEHNQPIEVSGYLVEVTRDTFENWQSEFLQLIWQVGGLAFLLYVGSPQSKESEERIEAKIDTILKNLDPRGSEKFLAQLENKYPKK